jgi:NRAMP (natural resistance-associated macrophage protein)-like metal ion transporter
MKSGPAKQTQLPRAPDPGTTNGNKAQASWLSKLGPGIVTGAADDDPSGIATYSQAGAAFGFNMLWSVLLTYPLMVAIQIISARIGRVSGHGLATNIRRHYPPWILHVLVLMLVVANTINIAADLAAMGDAVNLLAGGPSRLYATGFGVVSLLLQIFIPYHRYVRVLKWLTLALLAYIAVVFTVSIDWAEVGRALVLPQLSFERGAITTVVAVLGTTISPYLFFWQASEEVEHMKSEPAGRPIIKAPAQARPELERIQVDTYVGMGFSNLVAFFIILTAAVTLHAHGVHSIDTSAQAAQALRPIAGDFAFILFATGIIGTGLLAVPVLAGSAAYAMAGSFKWASSLEYKPALAKEFYGVIALATLGGVALGLSPIDPVKALYWSAVVNGVISAPVMVVTMLLASNHRVMGKFVIKGGLKIAGWLATAMMGLAVLTMGYTALFPG